MPTVTIHNKVATVDTEDLDLLFSYNWCWISGNYLYNRSLGLFHRYIMKASSSDIVDHINQDTADNRRNNLRLTNKGVNTQNSSRPCRGIHKRGNKFRAYIDFNKKRMYLGSHTSIIVAATYYDMAAIYLYGEFAALNYPERRDEYLEQLSKLQEGGEEDAI